MSVDRDSDPDPPTTAYPDCPVVDAHVHVMLDDLFDAVYGWFRAESDWTIPELDAATVVSRARERTDGFVFFPYTHRPGVAEGLNDTAAASAATRSAAKSTSRVSAPPPCR